MAFPVWLRPVGKTGAGMPNGLVVDDLNLARLKMKFLHHFGCGQDRLQRGQRGGGGGVHLPARQFITLDHHAFRQPTQ